MKAKSTTPAKTRRTKSTSPAGETAPAKTIPRAAAAEAKVTAPLPLDPLVFMHIPKTGGHTLRAILTEVYGDAVCPAQNWGELVKVDVSRYKVFIGHFGYEDARKAFGDVEFATFLREPNERLLSLYHYLQQTGQIDPDASLETYLSEIAPQRYEVDQIAMYLQSDKSLNYVVTRALDTLSSFVFVGQFEDFDGEIARLASTLGWSNVPSVPHLNTGDTERQSLDDLTPDERELLRYVNECDIDIYAHAIDEIWSQV